jgi:hypothetical protein
VYAWPVCYRGLLRSATGPTLDTGGRLTPTRRGLTARKKRRALLGVITYGQRATARDRASCGLASL